MFVGVKGFGSVEGLHFSVVNPVEEPMIPKLVDPRAELFLEYRKVDYSSNGVQLLRTSVEVNDVVVTVKVRTFALVAEHSVTRTKL